MLCPLIDVSVQVSNPRVSTGLTSSALDRAPGPSRNFVRGKSGYVPFLPGGLDSLKPADDVIDFQEGSSRLRTVAPGLSRGLRPAEDVDPDLVGLTAARIAAPEEREALVREHSASLNVADYVAQNGQTYGSLEEEDAPLGNGNADIDELLPTSVCIMRWTSLCCRC